MMNNDQKIREFQIKELFNLLVTPAGLHDRIPKDIIEDMVWRITEVDQFNCYLIGQLNHGQDQDS